MIVVEHFEPKLSKISQLFNDLQIKSAKFRCKNPFSSDDHCMKEQAKVRERWKRSMVAKVPSAFLLPSGVSSSNSTEFGF